MQAVPNKIPKHVAIVMDGNGRWAKQKKLPRIAGHKAGGKAVETAIKFAAEYSIQVLTLFAFSSENWGRPQEEVDYLMELFLKTLQRQGKILHKNNLQLRIIGDCSRFNTKLQQSILEIQQLTANNTGLKLVIAANYSGRWDILNAVRQIAHEIATHSIDTATIDTALFAKHLSLADLPEPDLLIRTSGEQRISNFMLWQCAYTELYFTETLWPDFSNEIFSQALQFYAQRQRRYGLTSEQIESETII